MVNVIKNGVILKKTSFDFENAGILNPAIFYEGNKVLLFYRTVSLRNYSIMGYYVFYGRLNIVERIDLPDLFPQADYKSQSLAYPQISKIDVPYYL
ncbi:MAG: pesticidal protein Cry7Aa, partial [Saprospiraceae bacterium]